MIIYTVVGEVDCEGIQGLIMSFKDQKMAEAFKVFCEYYNTLEDECLSTGTHNDWMDNHPAKNNYPYFGIVESELVGEDV
jgi:hypothetical protein